MVVDDDDDVWDDATEGWKGLKGWGSNGKWCIIHKIDYVLTIVTDWLSDWLTKQNPEMLSHLKRAKVTWSEVTFNANSVHFMLLPPFKHFNHLKNLSLKYMSSFPQSLSMSVDNVIKTCCYAELWLRPGKETESMLSNTWFLLGQYHS